MDSKQMSKLQRIIKAWTYLLFDSAPEDLKKLAKARAQICSECPSNVANICTGCGCPIPSKTLDREETCPKDKW